MTTQESERRAAKLRQIRGLLAKASDRAVTPEEADAFRAKADELMTRFAVEEFELLQGDQARAAVEVRTVDLDWWANYELDRDTRSVLLWLMKSVYRHCRTHIIWSEYGSRRVKVAGFPGDLDWADLLFTSLQMQLEIKVNPFPTYDQDFFQNLSTLRAAGLNWNEAAKRMISRVPTQIPADVAAKGFVAQREYMLHFYRAECRRRQVPQNYAHWRTFRRSFSEGFYDVVARRLHEMDARNADQRSDAGSQFALVIRDVRKTVYEWVMAEYPAERPKDTIAKGKRVSKGRVDTRKFDDVAYGGGLRAGERADISGHPGRRMGGGSAGQLEG